ncbi:PKD domain-containing protein [Pseudoalteromonas sp. OOF1S-7]|uniref:PKD domain-containing protein n=1 Tax=Pseudoalteromonas sp. OOF1S-7 TaxID=2917757 RepID=UPI001EF422CF|nr:PKD domain-containing protein [Pseudoalteromonas sp. OOF1S-7]MCG7537218.1 PKD domain-containing protein [Pseudoalteromonas sp. OOF1S-7]
MYKVMTGLLFILTCTVSASDAQYFWRFGDGSVSHEAEPEHEYTQPGIYTVTREVYQDGKLLESSQKQVDLISPKIVGLVILQPAEVVQGQNVEFLANLTSSEPLDLHYQWYVAGEPINIEAGTGKLTTRFAESGDIELSVDAMWQQTVVSSASTQLKVIEADSDNEKPDDGNDNPDDNNDGDSPDNGTGDDGNGSPGNDKGSDNKTPDNGNAKGGDSGGSLSFLILCMAGVFISRKRD